MFSKICYNVKNNLTRYNSTKISYFKTDENLASTKIKIYIPRDISDWNIMEIDNFVGNILLVFL